MLLGELLQLLSRWVLSDWESPAQVELRSAHWDSRCIKAGDLFVAIKGGVTDGAAFIPAAVAAGAAAVVCEGAAVVPAGVPVLRIRPGSGYQVAARIAEAFAGYPAKKLRLYGITGTCGKSTTAYLFRHILKQAGRRCGMLGTVVYDVGDGKEREASRTTPTPFELQRLFQEMVDNHLECAVLECSSAALDQERLGDARFDGAVFTNFSRDHLDYHHTMEEYFEAKKKLFFQYLSPNAPAVINLDDSYGAALAELLPASQVVGFRVPETTVASAPFECGLPGHFNRYNASAAGLLALHGAGVPETLVRQALLTAAGAPGRLEEHPLPSGARAFVDYAHTPEEISGVLAALRPLCAGRLSIVFGCGGDRDRGKRPQMAAAALAADRLWITSDNPRTEDPLAIIQDTLAGIPAGQRQRVAVEPERESAIRKAAAEVTAGDILVVAGKGHETYQEVNGVKIPFSDSQVLEDI